MRVEDLYDSAVSSVLLLAVFVAGQVTSELGAANVAVQCSELSARRNRLHAEIERLHAEAAMIEVELDLLCSEKTGQTDVGVPPILDGGSRPAGGTTRGVSGTQRIVPQPMSSTDHKAEQVPPARRTEDDSHRAYAVRCWAPSISFSDPSCNCFGETAHPALSSRRTIRIVVGGWYAHPAPHSPPCWVSTLAAVQNHVATMSMACMVG